MVSAVCAQRVSSDIVPDIGGERCGKIVQYRATPAGRSSFANPAMRFWDEESWEPQSTLRGV